VALLKEDPRSPRSPKATLKLKHKKTPITSWGKEELMLSSNDLEPAVLKAGYRRIPRREIHFREIKGDDMGGLREMLRELREYGCLR